MSPFTPDDAFALRPAWRGQQLTIEPLTGGITNRLFRVRASGGDDVVVRLHGERTELFIDRELEAEQLRLLELTDVTPRLVGYLPAQRATLVEYMPGRALTNADFLDAKLWPLVVEPIRRVHRSGLFLPQRFEPLVEVQRLHALYCDLDCPPPGFDLDGALARLPALAAAVADPGARPVPCHNDLLAQNFILHEGAVGGARVALIDWEYAGQGSPDYDLADLFQEILVPRDVERELLRCYWQADELERHLRLTDLYKPFADLYWVLWSLIQLQVSTIAFDYRGYATAKFGRAVQNLEAATTLHGVRLG